VPQRLSTTQKLQLRCRTLVDVIRALRPVYEKCVDDTQSDLVETLVGAALWYLPAFKQELWTGHISVAAVCHCAPGVSGTVRLSEEHEIPRKIAARELLAREWSGTSDSWVELELLYRTRYGRFRYVTPSENKALTKHQRKSVFTDVDRAYDSAGIQFISISREDLRGLRRRDPKIFDAIGQRLRVQPLTS